MPMPPRAFIATRRKLAAAAIWVLGWGLVGVAGPSAPSAWGQVDPESPLAWLRSAATAPQRVSYQGTKTVTVWTSGATGAQASQVRVYHMAPNRTRLEYLATGTQPERIVVITGQSAVEFIPSRNQYVRRRAPAADEEVLTRQILPQVLANYAVGFSGLDSVAGRSARIIDVRSRYPGRPHLRIWVDTQTRLILRFERYGPANVLREASAFLNLEVNPQLNSAFSQQLFAITPPPGTQVLPGPGGERMTREQIAKQVGFIPQLPAYLPSGYHLVGSRIAMIRGTPTATFAFTDGVSTVTLFESRGPIGPPRNGRPVRVGAEEGTVVPRGVATLLHWNSGGISFTLVGDLRQDELIRVGASVPRVGVSGDSTVTAWTFLRPPAAEAASVPPVPVSPYITNDTHPIGPGIRPEEEQIWQALDSRGLTPFVVKVTVASDGVTALPDGRLARLAWIWFVYGMDWTGDRSAILNEVRQTSRVLSAVAFAADPRVDRVTLSGYYHKSGRFDGRRTDTTFTARLLRDRLLGLPADLPAGVALAHAGDVWYSPNLLTGTLTEQMPMAHDPHLPPGVRTPGPVPAGDRSVESAERFRGTVWQRLLETKDRLAGLLFGMESGGRLWRGNPRRREIALTFDDGPSPLTTPLVLAILHRYEAHATFFVIGEHARAYPYLLTEMAADGHEVGDHTFHHPNMTTLDGETMAQEIGRTAVVIREAAGQSPRWFRPPGGDYTMGVAAAARRARMELAMWTENSGDWALPPAKIVAERVLIRAEPGSIILMHSTVMNTVRALPQIITSLQRRGYRFVTVSELAGDAE